MISHDSSDSTKIGIVVKKKKITNGNDKIQKNKNNNVQNVLQS